MSKRQAIDKLLSNRRSQDIEEFVEEGTAHETSQKEPAADKPGSKKEKKRANFEFDPQLHRDLKIFAAKEDKDMVEIVVAAVKEYMEKHKK